MLSFPECLLRSHQAEIFGLDTNAGSAGWLQGLEQTEDVWVDLVDERAFAGLGAAGVWRTEVQVKLDGCSVRSGADVQGWCLLLRRKQASLMLDEKSVTQT